jgi:hypothetical protein
MDKARATDREHSVLWRRLRLSGSSREEDRMLQPTATQRVRAFLVAEGVRLEPWTSLDETYTRLYSLLAERRDDPEFWAPLGRLMTELGAEAARLDEAAGASATVAELLSRTEIERLTADLRRALPRGAEAGEARSLAEFTSALGAPVLCAFLLLGLAASAGCTGSEEASAGDLPSPKAGVADVPAAIEPDRPAPLTPPAAPAPPETAAAAEPDAPWFDGCTLAQKGVLWRSIDHAALGADDKGSLCACFSELDRRWTNRLSYLFRNARPKEIAKALEEMVTCCAAEERDGDAACSTVTKAYKTVQNRYYLAMMGAGGVAYKGVNFE